MINVLVILIVILVYPILLVFVDGVMVLSPILTGTWFVEMMAMDAVVDLTVSVNAMLLTERFVLSSVIGQTGRIHHAEQLQRRSIFLKTHTIHVTTFHGAPVQLTNIVIQLQKAVKPYTMKLIAKRNLIAIHQILYATLQYAPKLTIYGVTKYWDVSQLIMQLFVHKQMVVILMILDLATLMSAKRNHTMNVMKALTHVI
jgi:hypothetical protein